ncbi:MAG: hypothetical protein L0220_12115 [Acidobacteria bacterium]|nr:hypothetical protein [Acidobacteriota bacterium]
MAGFIVLNDGRAWAGANWAYDSAIRTISQALPTTQEGQDLADWLLQQTCEVKGMGLGSVDLRELTTQNQTLFIQAVRQAVINLKTQDGNDWYDPTAFQSWREYFEVLPLLIESIERGEPPSMFNPHMNDLIPPTGNKSGPGWDQPCPCGERA